MENDVDAAGNGREFLYVAVEVGGVGGEVLRGGELARVDVDGDGDDVGELAGLGHEREVARVEEAHGGDQPNELALGPHRARPAPHRGLVGDHPWGWSHCE